MVEFIAFVVGCEYEAWTNCATRASNRHFHVETIDAKRCVDVILVLDANSNRVKILSTMLVC
jgi:hypothetical protein